jgi:hypothetical protein
MRGRDGGLRRKVLTYATMQFSKRMARIERAREQTLEQLYQLPESDGPEE